MHPEKQGRDRQSRGGLHSLERRRDIVTRLRLDGRVEVTELVERFATSAETIRKDLIALERRGYLLRVHGGAIPVQAMTFEPAIAARTENAEAKMRIAVKALETLPADGAILLDGGSTTLMMAEHLPVDLHLKVFTNSLPVAQALLAKPLVECFTLGGRVRHNTSAEVGPAALRTLGEIHVDAAYVGTNAVSFSRGLCTPDPDEAAVKAAMIRCATTTVLLVDHSKFGLDALCAYAGLDEIDVLITDSDLAAGHREDLESQSFEVELA
ncbi:DeoR/GlpR family DNA-binding transcription regulator [Arthrobacter sp. SW1]|uniref:DeoR/GlpR family DNA-binding transcription regulator n=1 Tax=Arthrobacter sp. SW1 TaxID=1920889 RepID=UPI000A45CB48|nr:DeoR/GlpR family DNA-binding transcription regulator [Arthrobacter sp. SW1]